MVYWRDEGNDFLKINGYRHGHAAGAAIVFMVSGILSRIKIGASGKVTKTGTSKFGYVVCPNRLENSGSSKFMKFRNFAHLKDNRC